MSRSIANAVKDAPASLIPQKIITDLEGSVALLEASLGYKTDEQATELSLVIDGERDDLIQAIKGIVLSTQYRKEEAIQSAGKHVEEAIRRRGWEMQSERNPVETASIYQLLADIKLSASLTADTVTIGIDDLLDQLKERNDAFEANENSRMAKRAVQKETSDPKAAKKLIACLGTLFSYLNSVSTVYPEAGGVIDSLNSILTPYVIQLKSRTTAAANAKDKNDM